MACWVGRGDKKRRRGRKGRSRIQGEERRHRTEGGRRRRGRTEDARGSGGGEASWSRERPRGVGPSSLSSRALDAVARRSGRQRLPLQVYPPYNAPAYRLHISHTHAYLLPFLLLLLPRIPSSDSYLSMPSLHIASPPHDAIMRFPHFHLATYNYSFKGRNNDPERLTRSSQRRQPRSAPNAIVPKFLAPTIGQLRETAPNERHQLWFLAHLQN